MLYHVYPSVPGEHECSSICLLTSGPCHLFYHDGAGQNCYVGNLGYYVGGAGLAPQAGVFYYQTDKFGKASRTSDRSHHLQWFQ